MGHLHAENTTKYYNKIIGSWMLICILQLTAFWRYAVSPISSDNETEFWKLPYNTELLLNMPIHEKKSQTSSSETIRNWRPQGITHICSKKMGYDIFLIGKIKVNKKSVTCMGHPLRSSNGIEIDRIFINHLLHF